MSSLSGCAELFGGDSAECTKVQVFHDVDGDGFGDPDRGEAACEGADGTATAAGDCDDQDPGVNPDATEGCEDPGVDEDCDGLVDEADPDLEVGSWFRDADGDGFGDSATSVAACEAPEGYLADASDCDDADPATNPSGQEVCDGGGDEDCDGLVDGADPSLDASVLPTWYPDNDGDGHAGAGTPVEACEPPVGYAVVADDCDDNNAAVFPGATEVCSNGEDDDCDGSPDGCGLAGAYDMKSAYILKITGAGGASLGYSVRGVGDVGGDGKVDIAVGAPNSGNDGASYLVRGGTTGILASSAADASFTGETAGASFGAALTSADLTGDGIPDLVVADSDYSYSSGYTYTGRVYVFAAPFAAAESASGADTVITNNSGAGEYLGLRLGIGDVKNDGAADLLIMRQDDSFDARVIAVPGPLAHSSGEDLSKVSTLDVGFDWASAVAGTQDVSGDGIPDLLVGDGSAAGVGSVMVLSDPSRSTTVTNTLTGARGVVGFGTVIDVDGDANGDGYADLLVGAWNTAGDAASSGAAWLCFGPLDADRTSTACEVTLPGDQKDDMFAYGLAWVGDENGDGASDLLIGAPRATGGAKDSGVAYLYRGTFSAGTLHVADADAAFLGATASGQLGVSVAAAGDFNGDGAADLLIGAPGESSAAGAAYVVAGGGY